MVIESNTSEAESQLLCDPGVKILSHHILPLKNVLFVPFTYHSGPLPTRILLKPFPGECLRACTHTCAFFTYNFQELLTFSSEEC